MDPDSLLHAHRKFPLDIPNRSTQTPTSPPPPPPPPPPAYTATAPRTNPHHLPITLPSSTLLARSHNTGDDDLPPAPPITIKIDASLKIVGHGNVLAYTPTETATRALRQARPLEGGGWGGEEMRPVEISVGAGVSVVGCRNVVGVVGLRGMGVGVGRGEGKAKAKAKEGRKREASEDAVEMPRAKKVEV